MVQGVNVTQDSLDEPKLVRSLAHPWVSFHQGHLGYLLDEALPLFALAGKLYSISHMRREHFTGL